MAPRPYLRPTTLQQLRTFLEESGSPVPPWTGFDEVFEAVLALLHRRRDDAAFFARLAPFLEELRANAARGEAGLPTRDAEILGEATLEGLLADLQAALRSTPRELSAGALRGQLASRAAPLLCLTLLASALSGCPDRSAVESDGPGVPAPVASAPAQAGASGAASAASGDAGVTTDAMVEMFKNQSPEETASWLERLLKRDPPPSEGLTGGGRTGVQIQRKAIKNFGSNSHSRYKGVSF